MVELKNESKTGSIEAVQTINASLTNAANDAILAPTIVENPNNSEDNYRLDITDKNGKITTPNLIGPAGQAGERGLAGEDGISPIVRLEQTAEGVVIVITDAEGEHRAVLLNGEAGPVGPQGIQGEQGEQGPTGPKGENGADAYEVWLELGNTGTREDFLNAMKGDTGDQGEVGPAGPQGEQGVQGKQALVQIAPRDKISYNFDAIELPWVVDGLLTGGFNRPAEDNERFIYYLTTKDDVDITGFGEACGPTGDAGCQAIRLITMQKTRGEQGPQGETGPQGTQGPAGATGASGTTPLAQTAAVSSGYSSSTIAVDKTMSSIPWTSFNRTPTSSDSFTFFATTTDGIMYTGIAKVTSILHFSSSVNAQIKSLTRITGTTGSNGTNGTTPLAQKGMITLSVPLASITGNYRFTTSLSNFNRTPNQWEEFICYAKTSDDYMVIGNGVIVPPVQDSQSCVLYASTITVLTGAAGTQGNDGKSAYQIAVEQGFEGTEAEWLESLRGPVGETGATGEQGPAGQDGEQGPAGYTPQKGVDYFTDADKEEIKQAVIDDIEIPEPGASTAADVSFDNTDTGLTATDVQSALVEINDDLVGSEEVQDMIDDSATLGAVANFLYLLRKDTNAFIYMNLSRFPTHTTKEQMLYNLVHYGGSRPLSQNINSTYVSSSEVAEVLLDLNMLSGFPFVTGPTSGAVIKGWNNNQWDYYTHITTMNAVILFPGFAIFLSSGQSLTTAQLEKLLEQCGLPDTVPLETRIAALESFVDGLADVSEEEF